MGLFDLFKRGRKSKNEFTCLNDSCNSSFEAVFNKCRLDYGHEMVEIMDLKLRLLEKVSSPGACTPVQELLAKKILELISLYFKIIDIYVTIKNINRTEERDLQTLDGVGDKMKKVYSLIYTLNSQFYLSCDEIADKSKCDEIIYEAEALRNVIKDSYFK